jgi:putative ABC transport system substrate-binding protein
MAEGREAVDQRQKAGGRRFILNRRDLITLLSGAAISSPLVARTQQKATPIIGFLNSASPSPFVNYVAAFRRGLQDEGYADGQNLAIEFRWAEGQNDRLPALAADLINHQVSVIAATGGPASAFAAKAATDSIPIVFTMAGDPVKRGLVASLNHPGGNITGYNFVAAELDGKRLGLLHELVPDAEPLAALLDPKTPNFGAQTQDIDAAARILGRRITIITAASAIEIDAALAKSQLGDAVGLADRRRSVLQQPAAADRRAGGGIGAAGDL